MSTNQLADYLESQCPPLAAFKKLIEELTPDQRLYLLAYIENRPDLFGEIRCYTREVIERVQSRIVKSMEAYGQTFLENDKLRREIDRRGNCAKARKAIPARRKEAIDKAFEAAISKKRMYHFMCEHHPELLPSRKKNNGKKDPFMTQEKMWESYYKHGGTRH